MTEPKTQARPALRHTAAGRQEAAVAMFRREGFVFDGKGGRWEKCAFTLYNLLVEALLDEEAEAAAAPAAAEPPAPEPKSGPEPPLYDPNDDRATLADWRGLQRERAAQPPPPPDPVCDILWLTGPASAMCLKCGNRFDAHRTEDADEPPRGVTPALDVERLAKAVEIVGGRSFDLRASRRDVEQIVAEYNRLAGSVDE